MDGRSPRRKTLILGRADIGRLMAPRDYVGPVEAAFVALAEGRATMPAPLHLPAEGGAFHAKGARLAWPDGRDFAAVKINGNFPGNPARCGLPTIQGALVLSDARNGAVLALMDSTEITRRRTAAATAIALDRLALPKVDKYAVIGCGDLGLAQLEAALAYRRPKSVSAYDGDAEALARFVSRAKENLAVAVEAAASVAEALRQATVVLTATTATTPIVGRATLAPGTFVAAVGADAPHKSEIAPEVMREARIVVDAFEQCAAFGDLRHAIAAGVVKPTDVAASLGDVLLGRWPGRRTPEDIVVFDSTGLAVQDVAAGVAIYDRALATGAGTALVLG